MQTEFCGKYHCGPEYLVHWEATTRQPASTQQFLFETAQPRARVKGSHAFLCSLDCFNNARGLWEMTLTSNHTLLWFGELPI